MRLNRLVVAALFAVGLLATTAQTAELCKKEAKEGFVQLFDGKTLDGWVGAVKGYTVEDGAMVCKPGGNIYTEKEYSDFVFRFEFKIPPGGNNGVGIRTPTKGDAAYAGMEIQILDDRHEAYKGIRPYQAHGSIYGVAPAKRDHLKPAGEWNCEEISAIGPKIKITLNGTVITEADLSKIEP